MVDDAEIGDEALVGKLGHITVAVRGPEGPGEVQVPFRGGSEAYIAYADHRIERGVQVLVIGRREGRALDVTPFTG